MFIDIHNHTLFGVDDGPQEIAVAEKMLMEAKSHGADAIILTPHYRRGMFLYPVEDIEQNFKALEQIAQAIGLKLFLGCEYHVNSDLISNIQSGRCKTLAGSDYVLTEYSYQTEYSYIAEQTHRLLSCGYFPVIAHVERYKCLFKHLDRIDELVAMETYLQMNVSSVYGGFLDERARWCKKLVQEEYISFFGTDAHDLEDRAPYINDYIGWVKKKCGEDMLERIFMDNPMKMIENKYIVD